MADVRALLKAKRQEIRINHPLASYTSSGQLRCIACSTIIKQSSSWEGHVGSKAHRTNAARLRQEERLREQQQREEEERAQKRKAADVDIDMDDEPSHAAHPPKPSGLPADFFSDPSHAPPPPSDESDDEALPAAPTAIDLEWQQFQEAVIDAPDARETYERATIFAEPLLADEVPKGFPAAQTVVAADAAPTEALTEDQLRRKREQEDREIIMDRLLDEEQAQEEADARQNCSSIVMDRLSRQHT
ncbi:hypothetical protein A0H81_07474 [Grifola frondosa]|uniref:Uncharacterized protein n=1 Tax=Grifola frondosa TaxID=5627 RepID=A0A1C7M6S7_GRIFR|nr:hypothetical protein A0H81_07474 [Grifola frondosa]